MIPDILKLIAQYAASYKLLDWIPLSKINWRYMSMNGHVGSIAILRENPDNINWLYLAETETNGAVELFKENPDKINWR